MENNTENMVKTNLIPIGSGMREFIEASRDVSYKQKSELCVNNLGYEQCPPGYQYGPRVCPYHLIHFVTAGEGELYMEEKCFPVHAGDAFLIPADRIAWYRASRKNPWRYAWAGFLGFQADSYFYQLMEAADGRCILHHLNTPLYERMIMEAAALKEVSLASYFHANSALLRILGTLFEELRLMRQGAERPGIADEVRYYLEMRYSERIRLKDLAHRLGVHPNYMTRVFREKFGVAPKQYLTDLKLTKACRLLESTDYTIALIADTLGFEDQMAFSKTFRGKYGMAPSEYRRKAETGA